MSTQSILIVEDEPVLAFVLQDVFEGRGFKVLLANDGAKALEILKSKTTPDIVLTDLYLPKHNGAEIVAYIRSTASLKHLPVVVVSGSLDTEPLKDHSYQALIAKPFDLIDLISVVEHYVQTN